MRWRSADSGLVFLQDFLAVIQVGFEHPRVVFMRPAKPFDFVLRLASTFLIIHNLLHFPVLAVVHEFDRRRLYVWPAVISFE
jgi:hypothetical protein